MPRRENHAPAIDLRPALEKKPMQLVAIETPIGFPVEPETDTALRAEPRLEILEEKFPLCHTPEARGFVTVEADHESGDEIEFPPEIGESDERLDAPDNAAESEQHHHFAEHWHLIDIETERVVPEGVGDKKEIARSASEIEDASAKTPIETELAHAAQVFRHPSWQIKVFGPAIPRLDAGIAATNRFKLLSVDRLNQVFRLEFSAEPSSQHHAVDVPASAFQRSAILKFAELLREAHWVADLIDLTLELSTGSGWLRNVILPSSKEAELSWFQLLPR